MTSTTPHAGWYPDQVPDRLRWFDGSTWTEHVIPAPAAQPQRHPGHVAATSPLGTRPGDPMHWVLPTGRSGWAIAAGYLALVAVFVWPLGPFALLAGVLGLRAIRRRLTHGAGRAWFGVVVGALTTVGCVWLLVQAFGP